jgi:predicted dehydrogenase
MKRRTFLRATAAALAAPAILRAQSQPSNTVRLAFIGLGGRGTSLLKRLSASDVVCTAYCDCNQRRWAAPAELFPQARPFQDYRRMLDEAHRDIDGVVVATPDHHHVTASIRAVRLGKAVYCEKPLAYSLYEARALARATVEHKVPTQCGNQGHANLGNRLAVEWVRDGAIDRVIETHTWTDRPAHYWQHGLKEIPAPEPVPADFDWESWLGPRSWPHYSGAVQQSMWWRSWYDLGTGAIGDQICHGWENVFWSVDAGAPTSAEPVDLVGKTNLSPPLQSSIKYTFPAKGNRPAFEAWYHTGGRKPPIPPAYADDPVRQKDGQPAPLPATGTMYIGEKGVLLCAGDYCDSLRLVPESLMQSYSRPEPWIPRSPGHDREWLMAIRGEKPWDFPGSNFTYSGPLTEVGLLGIVAERLGRKVEWDSASLRVTNEPEAEQYVKPAFRAGWEV